MAKITEKLGIRYPIIQGGMQYISRSPLVIAVSNAGGLGVLTTASLDAEGLREEIQVVRKNTNKPFGVNLTLLQENIDELVDTVIEEKVPIVTTGAGSPKKYVPRLKEAGIKVFPVIASVKHAVKMEELEVDGLIVEGQAAGGHIGNSSTMPLIRQVVNTVDIPVIAAGGIGDGQGLVAAFALGAEAVQMGTIFLATKECPIPDSYKREVVKAVDTSTIVTGRKGGHPVRSLRNEMVMQYSELEFRNTPEEELEKLTVGSLQRAVVEGDMTTGSVTAGEISGVVNEIVSVKSLMDKIMQDAKKTLKELKERQL